MLMEMPAVKIVEEAQIVKGAYSRAHKAFYNCKAARVKIVGVANIKLYL